MNQILSLVAILMIGASVFAQEEYRPRGYAGFVEEGLAGMITSSVSGYPNSSFLHSSTATIHGYQINPNWFVGAGIAVNLDVYLKEYTGSDPSEISLPIFADVRWDMTKKRISPFLDIRAGYSPCGDARKGAYVSPTIGVDFFFTNHPKLGLYCGIMYEFQQCNDAVITTSGLSSIDHHYVGAKFGFRW